jgi:hypothetical protein
LNPTEAGSEVIRLDRRVDERGDLKDTGGGALVLAQTVHETPDAQRSFE